MLQFSRQSSFCCLFAFSPHCQAYGAGCGRDNCCPLDAEAGRLTIQRSLSYCCISFCLQKKKKKWHWQKHRHLSVYLSLSLSLSSLVHQRSDDQHLFLFFSLLPLNANLRRVKASKSLFMLMLQWDWPAHYPWYKECSVNHTSTVWKGK